MYLNLVYRKDGWKWNAGSKRYIKNIPLNSNNKGITLFFVYLQQVNIKRVVLSLVYTAM